MSEKTCTRCKRTLDASEFGKTVSGSPRKICNRCAERAHKKQQESVAKKKEYEKGADNVMSEIDSKPEVVQAKTTEAPALNRKKRVPLTDRRVLDYQNKDPNKVYRVFNDGGKQRLEFAEAADWQYVRDDDPEAINDRTLDVSRGTGSVVSRPVGNGRTGYLMWKDKEEYDEDIALDYERAAELEADIVAPPKRDDFYQATDSRRTKITHGLHNVQPKHE